MSDPHAYTEEEVRDQFLDHVWRIARYWAGLDGSNVPEDRDALDRITGFAHSLLATVDGCTPLPAFKLVVDPHPDDREYRIEQGENYYPEGVDIGGFLHEQLYRRKEER